MNFRQAVVPARALIPHDGVRRRPDCEEAAILSARHQPVEPVALDREGIVIEKENPRGRALARK